MSKPLVTFAAFALLAWPAVAGADEPASDKPDTAALFGQLDTNKDALLATDEIPEDRKSLFERLLRIGDKNKDGQLDADEFAAALADGRKTADTSSDTPRPDRPDAKGRPEPGKLFERLDANGDGKVVLDEVPEKRREMFQKLIARVDKDGDGAVTREEFAKAPPPPGGDAGKPGKRPESGRGPAELFKRMDRNADGKVTADEVPEERRAMVAKMIERGDKDGDQALSLEEFSKVFSQRKGAPPAEGDTAKRKKA
ncbi:MAG: hypothetical protein WDZ48_04330, partial [Pirellulales bacterium]